MISVSSDATNDSVSRPKAIPMPRLRLDERYAEVVTHAAPWQTPNYAAAADRYDIVVESGASNLSVVSYDNLQNI